MARLEKKDLMTGLFGIDKSVENKTDPANTNNMELSVDELFASENNHFRVEMNDDMDELKASIKMNGVLSPLIVRERKGAEGYEIVSGHRRHMAATLAGLKTVPVVIKELSDEDRDIIIADSNLQRPQILISEKAWAIRLKYDAIKRKTGRKKECLEMGDPGSPISKTADIIAEQMGMSDRAVQRNIRLTYLFPPLLTLVDTGNLPLKAGVQLSYLSEQAQQSVFDIIDIEKIKVNEVLAGSLRDQLSEGATMDEVYALLKPKPNISKQAVRSVGIKVNKNIRKKYFPKDYNDEDVNEVIVKMLDKWAAEFNPEYKDYNPGE